MGDPLVSLIPFLFIILLFPAVATSTLPIPKSKCNSKCGDIQVPYPFGIGTDEECFYSQSFKLVCKKTANSSKLIFGGGLEVVDVSYEGQLTLLSAISYECYDSSGLTANGSWKAWLRMVSHDEFTLSETENKFTTLGCDTISSIIGTNGLDFRSGCIMFCKNKADVMNGSCTGIGCCQNSIPKGFANFQLSLRSMENHTAVLDFNPCSYAFIVKTDWFNFSNLHLSKFTSPYKIDGKDFVPVVYDWAIEAKSCEKAVNNATYACSGKRSECANSKNGRGYSCVCAKGYEGNPYLQDGCQDIDECQFASIHNCSQNAKCKNIVGNYSCHCPLGYRGDGWKNGTSLYGEAREGSECHNNVIPIIAGISASFLVLPVLIWFLYWAKKKRERMVVFQENGGKLLKERLNSRKEDTAEFKFFPIKEVQRATQHFLEGSPVQGVFGAFFKGTLSDGKVVMVRRYPLNKSQMKDQIIQFVNEVDILSRINHKHVVKLLGCCLDTQIPMLVYEYCSLVENLPQHIQHLSWDDRLRIAAETADVLDHLHSVPVFHEKFESSDILLQGEKKDDGSLKLVAKVCDFKASRLAPLYQSLRGELGHKNDELEATDKSDVYCFGVVLVELLTGKKTDIRAFKCTLTKLMEDGKDFSTILDEKIAKDAKEEQLQVVAKLVMECLKDRSEDRPAMKKVKKELEPFSSTSNP